MSFKVKVAFEGRRPFQHLPLEIINPFNTEDLARVMQLHHTVGRLLVIDCIEQTQYEDPKWHDAMAAEGLPTEHELDPTSDTYLTDKHINFLI